MLKHIVNEKYLYWYLSTFQSTAAQPWLHVSKYWENITY